MSESAALSRALHDLGLAAWFGGSLMGAVGGDRGSGPASAVDEIGPIDDTWSRWRPVQLAAIGAHVIGAVGVTFANEGRLFGQKKTARDAIVKTALTAAALGATFYGQSLTNRMRSEIGRAADGDADVARLQRQLTLVRWAVPVLTGAALVVGSDMGEQQRPKNVIAGMKDRVVQLLPELPDMPSVHLPHLSDMHLPDVHLPDVHLPHLPHVSLPKSLPFVGD